ncbi:transketolase-like protein 2 isoform X3 [Cydia splendana]
MAYVGKYFDQAPYRVYCLVGDGEAAEGSIWESLHFASHYKLDNLVVIFDVNRLGQSEPTSLQHHVEVYDARLKSFGFHSLVVDGHDVTELVKAFDEAATVSGKPTALVAKTFKGKGFPGIEDLENWHGKALGADGEKVIKHLQSQIKNNTISLKPKPPLAEAPRVHIGDITLSSPPAYKQGEQVATRLAYGTALKKIADTNLRVIALDGDTKNSTFSDKLRNAYPDRYIECFIAEQNLVGVATGAACRDRTVAFVSTFAAFFSRTFDQIRMGAISQSNINLAGSHCGVSIGEDGPSQMGLEDLALFRAVPTATVFYPSDAVSTERAVELAANTKGICYIRTSRPNTSMLYPNDEVFKVGQAKVVRQSPKDQVLLIGAGITLHESVAAAEALKAEGINARVLDPFTIKPLDEAAVLANARACGGRVVVVEDHYQAGGIGEAVLSAVALQRDVVVKHVFVTEVPRSGPPAALLDKYGLSAPHIASAARAVLKA